MASERAMDRLLTLPSISPHSDSSSLSCTISIVGRLCSIFHRSFSLSAATLKYMLSPLELENRTSWGYSRRRLLRRARLTVCLGCSLRMGLVLTSVLRVEALRFWRVR